MKILVTGADGFIGSHLAETLTRDGHDVRALTQYNSFGDLGWLEQSARLDELEVVSGDIRDAAFCRSLVAGVDRVFHLAALIAIPFSYRAPGSYVDTNVNGTLNLCQAALDAGVDRLVHTSTSEVYGTARYAPIDEAHPLQAQSPYSASKIGADAIATSFHRSFELPVVIARPFNTYGPRQSARAVIPTIITQIAAGARELDLGDTTPTRDFNFVTDTCDGFRALADCDAAVGEVVNIGSGREISIADLVTTIGRLMNADVTVVRDEQRLRPPASEVFRLLCDPGRIHALTSWAPRVSLEDGLARTADWFRDPANLARYKAGTYAV